MLARLNSLSIFGLQSTKVEVEVDMFLGLPKFQIVGLGDTAIQEAKHRVKSAIKNSGLSYPRGIVVANLAPADCRKQGPAFDLAIALGIAIITDQINIQDQKDSVFLGELALNGDLRHINGILPLVLGAKEHKFKKIYLPAVNYQEATIIDGIEIIPINNLRQLINHFNFNQTIQKPIIKSPISFNSNYLYDFSEIKGQSQAKRALQIAASGGHNVILNGPPGSGKTLLSRTFRSILPPLSKEEVLEITKIYSIAGLLPNQKPLITNRPFRTPHHTASAVSLVGGGRIPSPGEITLAHQGVLFLDELPEFPRTVLEVLRQPLEDRIITIARAQGTLTFPASFIMIASMNPCPCGFYTDPEKECTCTQIAIDRYQKKISGPLLDRIDIHLEVPRLKWQELQLEQNNITTSKEIKAQVILARKIQTNRFQKSKTNAEMNNKEIRQHCQLDQNTKIILQKSIEKYKISARGYYRILKVARTIADINNHKNIQNEDLKEAIQFRERKF